MLNERDFEEDDQRFQFSLRKREYEGEEFYFFIFLFYIYIYNNLANLGKCESLNY